MSFDPPELLRALKAVVDTYYSEAEVLDEKHGLKKASTLARAVEVNLMIMGQAFQKVLTFRRQRYLKPNHLALPLTYSHDSVIRGIFEFWNAGKSGRIHTFVGMQPQCP